MLGLCLFDLVCAINMIIENYNSRSRFMTAIGHKKINFDKIKRNITALQTFD